MRSQPLRKCPNCPIAVRDQGVAGSNPVSPTKQTSKKYGEIGWGRESAPSYRARAVGANTQERGGALTVFEGVVNPDRLALCGAWHERAWLRAGGPPQLSSQPRLAEACSL